MPTADDLKSWDRSRSKSAPVVVLPPPKLLLPAEVHNRFPSLKSTLDDFNQKHAQWGQEEVADAIRNATPPPSNLFTSPGGNKFKIVVDDSGNLTTKPLT